MGRDGVSPEARIEVSQAVLSLDEPLTIRGSGFKPGEPVAILLIIDENLSPLVGVSREEARERERTGSVQAQVTASSAGTFVAEFDHIGTGYEPATRERALGEKAIAANGDSGSKASVPVTIVSEPQGPPSASTSLTVDPVATGSNTSIWGAGFKPNESVTISVTGAANGQDLIVADGAANDFGAFAMSATITLEPDIYTLKAVGDRGSEATAPLLVSEE